MSELNTGVYTDANGISREVPIAVDATGRLLTTGGGGGGGGTSDATAALQTTGNTSLAAIDGKLVADKKATVVGTAATATLAANLLDSAGSTDVTSYRSAQITIVTVGAPLQYAIRGAIQTGFSSGGRDLLTVNPDTGLVAPSATTQAANTTATYLIDLSTANFLRIPQISGGVGAIVTAVFSKYPISQLRSVAILDPLVKQQLDREAGTVITPINRFGDLPPTTTDYAIGNTKVCRLHFVNYTPTQLFIQFHNRATALISGVSVPASSEVYPITGFSPTEPGILLMTSGDFVDSGNWGVNSRVAVSTTRAVYTAPSAAILAQTTINIETTTLV